MKLFFAPAELLLEPDAAGEYVLKMQGTVIGRFKQQKRAISEFNRRRSELEASMPPVKLTANQMRDLLQKAVGDSLVGHNSWLAPSKATAKSRVHHS